MTVFERARDLDGDEPSPLLVDLAHIATALMTAVNAIAWPLFFWLVFA